MTVLTLVNAEVRAAKRQLRKCLLVCSVAFMMNYAAYGGLLFLQSSINIEDGLGTSGLVVIYATSSFSTIFFIPFLIDFKGAKTAIIAGEMGIFIYTLANFYPRWYTIIPAAICHGFTEAASWAGTSCYVTYLGEKYSELKQQQGTTSARSIAKESCVYRFFSVFYVFVYSSQVVGNALVSTVLYSLMDKRADGNTSSNTSFAEYKKTQYTASTPGANLTSDKSWKLCGSNLCNENIDTEELDKYEPSPVAVYCLLTLFVAIQLTFTLVHVLALPGIPTQDRTYKGFQHATDDGDVWKICAPRMLSAVKREYKETFRHIVSPLHLLIFPFVFYSGVFVAFAVVEFPRSFVSCTLGVEYVGFVIVAYGLASMAMSATSTKIIPLLGRNACIGAMYLMHATTFLLCLLWVPSRSTIWLIFVVSACLGACDGIMTNITQGMFATYFEDRLAIAFSVKNFATNLGIVAGSSWSEVLCVDVKLYILFGILVMSIGTYVAAESFHRRRHKEKNIQSDDHSDDLQDLHVGSGLAT